MWGSGRWYRHANVGDGFLKRPPEAEGDSRSPVRVSGSSVALQARIVLAGVVPQITLAISNRSL